MTWQMRQSIQEWTKENLWNTVFKKYFLKAVLHTCLLAKSLMLHFAYN